MLLISCSAQISDYKNSYPIFKLEDYFNGNIKAWGILQDYNNKLTRNFTVDITASWQGNKGKLHEAFVFDDGETQTRIWYITKLKEGFYQGEANDVIGTANIEQMGNAVNLVYELTVKIDDSDFTFKIDDWMYRVDEKHVFNRSKLKKFGVTVAELTLFFEKQN